MGNYRDERDVLRERLADAEARAAVAEDELRRTREGQPTLTALAGDTLFGLSKVALWLQFAAWALFVLVSFPVYISIAHENPGRELGGMFSPTVTGCLIATIVDACFAPVAVVSLLAVRALGKGKRSGWGLSVAAGVLGTLCGCLPLGALVLASMLRARVRTAFLG